MSAPATTRAGRPGALRRPSASVLHRIARGLRVSADSLCARAGSLDGQPPAEQQVTLAIMASPLLNERQKRVLLDIHASFRRANECATPRPVPGPGFATEPPAAPGATSAAWCDRMESEPARPRRGGRTLEP